MKQFQFEFKNVNNFRKELVRIKRFCNHVNDVAKPVFQFFTQVLKFEELKDMIDIIETDFPDSYYYGCQSFGNIIDGKFAKDKTLIICSVWECESTLVEPLFIDPANDNAQLHTLNDLWEYSNSLGWVKGIEIISSYHASELLKFGEGKISLAPEVKVFGAIAINPMNITAPDSFVFSKAHGVSTTAMMAFLLGGEELSVDCFCCSGWDGLGKNFHITKSDGKIIHEIDNEPASNIYKKYLGIDYDDHFVNKALRFPLLIETNGMECVRIPMPTNNPNDIELTVEPKQGARVRLAFGETSKILDSINRNVRKIYDFAPDTIRIYSCATRRLFWGDDKISLETSMLDGIAATVGFYTRGELMRFGDYLQYFNATIVTCLVREGEAVKAEFKLEDVLDSQSIYHETSKSLLRYLEEVSQEIESSHNETMSGIANTYTNMFEFDIVENTVKVLKQNDASKTSQYNGLLTTETIRQVVEKSIIPEHLELAYDFFDLSTLENRLKNKTYIDEQFIGKIDGWFRAQFIPISHHDGGGLKKVILTLQTIDEEKKKEESLLRMSYTDQQTGLSNRNSYELDTRELVKSNLNDKFVYISMDLNGLKKINDTKGHIAGDDLIYGAASCLKGAMGKYGKVYRIGGDEFSAIIYATARQLETILEDFENLRSAWKSKYIDGISVSMGIVSKREFPNLSFNEMEKIADERMYSNKVDFYKNKWNANN